MVDEKIIYFNKNDFSENKVVEFSKIVYISNVSMKEVSIEENEELKKLSEISE